MKKTALILHGFPQPVGASDGYLIKYLQNKEYEVCCPYLLEGDWDFNWQNITKHIIQKLNDKIPDVVIGISMGGLFLPNLAKNWPNAKLIFLASGPNLNLPNTVMLPINMIQTDMGYHLIKLILKIPDNVLVKAYGLLDRWIEGPGEHDQSDLQSNVYYMRLVSKKRVKELVKLLKTVDNSDILQKMQNPSLVINGKFDVLMGASQGKALSVLLSNNKYIENTRSHFNVFTKNDLKHLDEFLQN